ncbi:MAG: hypothetical protein FWG66_00225 [Spirochaetes bacterium]|nr:hypothetical protein [Spirochaetota bacterium]
MARKLHFGMLAVILAFALVAAGCSDHDESESASANIGRYLSPDSSVILELNFDTNTAVAIQTDNNQRDNLTFTLNGNNLTIITVGEAPVTATMAADRSSFTMSDHPLTNLNGTWQRI